jgi:hypothetical protein
MVDLFGVDTDLWTAGAAVAQTIIVGAAAVFAFRQVREAQLTREDQSRPFVILDFDLSRPPFIHLVIKNIGATMARRVRIQTDPPLASSFDKNGQSEPIAKLRLFSDQIPTMAPGREIRTFFDSFSQREQQQLDDVYQVTITYEGERGRSYVDEMVLDLGIYRNTTFIDQHTIHDVHKQLKRIADEVRRWSASGSGIKVVSRKDQREDHALAVRHFRARPESSLAPREVAEETVQWTLRRLRQRASRALAVVSMRVDPDE